MNEGRRVMARISRALGETEREQLAGLQSRVHTLENRVRIVTQQRDQHRAQFIYMRRRVRQLQQELLKLRAKQKKEEAT